MLLSRAAEVALATMPLLDPRGPAPDARGRGIRELSQEARVPGPFLAKVFQRLVGRGLLRSKRGRTGGFLLGRPAAAISVADVVLALEGREELHAAFPAPSGPAGALLEPLRERAFAVMRDTTLADLKRRGDASASGLPGGVKP